MASAQSNLDIARGLVATANATTGKEDATLTDAIGSLISGYGQGGGSGDNYYNVFWDTFQLNGERLSYENAFKCDIGDKSTNYKKYQYWTKDTFKPKYDIKPTRANNMFHQWTYTDENGEWLDLEKHLQECGVVLDVSNTTVCTWMFGGTSIKVIPELLFPDTVTSFQSIFYSSNVTTIRKFKVNRNAVFTSSFYGCANLENIIFVGEIGKSLNIASSPKLSDASIQSIIDCLVDLTGETAQVLTFYADVKAKLTEAQIAQITSKNWTLA